jgi:hypothetical protein
MQRPLDPLNFKQNTYQRPTQEWNCGRAAEGHPCPLGPDKRGKCRATGECQPARKGDRWSCTRIEASGGQCEEGPRPDGACCHPIPPCQPVRSLRRQRRLAVSLAVALTIGALFYLLGGKWGDRWLEPGELSAVHGISGGHSAGADNCGDCHSVRQTKTEESATTFLSHRQLADSQLCLKCHALGEHPMQAHAVDARALAQLTAKAQSAGSEANAPLVLQVSRAFSGIDAEDGQLACATCHREHHGRDANLSQFADAQCQVCHAVQFHSFTKGHPEFAKYPYLRRTRIFFDHTSHLEKHFTGERKDVAPTSCQDCHMAEASGRLMLVKDFEQTCAACHAGEIKGDGMEKKGLAFFSVPELDVETLESKGRIIGEWPKADGELTPFMKLLLGADPVLRAAIEKLHGVELGDLTNASEDKLDAAEKLAWGVKSLLFDLTTGGHDMLFKRLGTNLSDERNRMIPELSGRMSRATVVAAQQEWMPHLLSEVPDFRKGIKPPRRSPAETASAPPAPSKPAHPGAKGDLLDASASPTAPKDKKSGGGDDSILDTSDILPAPNHPAPQGNAPARGGNAATSQSKAKGPAPDDEIPLSNGLDAPSPKSPGKVKPPSDFWVNPLYAPKPKIPVAEKTPAVEIMAPEDWMATGGWYRPLKSFTLLYRPVGHADPFLTAWLTTLAGMSTESSTDLAGAAFRKLADPEAPGACMKCHTVDARGGAILVNWLPARPEPHAHPFTAFNHTAHFSLLTDQGCQTCHQLAPESDYPKFFTPADGVLPDNPSQFASNFAPLSKAICAECHKSQVAGDNCLLCHRYHTGAFAEELKSPFSKHGMSQPSAQGQ